VVDAIRIRLVDQTTPDPAGLVAVARRLVAIDPDRAGIGGLRLQLELALFAGQSTAPSTAAAPGTVSAPATAAAPAPVTTAPPTTSTDPLPTPKPATTLKAAAKPGASRVGRSESPPPVEPTPTPKDEPAAVGPTTEAATDVVDHPAVAVPIAVGDDLDRLLDGWPEIVKSVSPATRAVLTECRPIGVEGNVVTLGFPEAKGFLKDHAERRRQDVEMAVGGLLGRPVSVRTVATNIEVAPLGAADDLVAEARRIFGEDLVDVAEID
jgi:hypothetical protein